jgi:subtilisin family serine protease
VTNTPEGDSGLDRKTTGQAWLIVRAFAEHEILVRPVFGRRGLEFMYEPGVILVRDEYLPQVEEIVGVPGDRPPTEPDGDNVAAATDERRPEERLRRVIRGVVLLSLAGSRFSGDDEPDRPGTLAALAEIDAILGTGAATPNHVLTVSPNGAGSAIVHTCPATEPAEVPDGIEPRPGRSPGLDGEGVRIYVADTGLLAGSAEHHGWLHGVEGDLDPLPNPAAIPPYTGHGTFVAGVLRCVAPGATIYVGDVFSIAGSALESQAVPRLSTALQHGFDLFNLTIATATRKNLPLIAFDAWRHEVSQYGGVACVVAAGNSGVSQPFWPAAFPDMVSVGALAADERTRASFSNHGGWVDVYAPGRDLINAYARGTYICRDFPYEGQQREFFGMCNWSGTSFSTPIVTGLIAARISRTGENGRQAAAALIALAQAQAIPGVGAILRAGQDSA